MSEKDVYWPWCFFGRHLSIKEKSLRIRLHTVSHMQYVPYCMADVCSRSPSKQEANIFEDILNTFGKDQREKIRKNIKLTPLPEIDEHVKNYPEAGETGCPVTISKYSEEEKVKRYPDAIGIGFAKSGTGTMAYFDCHPDVVYSG